ncbi:MAG: hypothetical protein HOO06_01115 [Bdellovibrionaceae bacterium]|jgi:hypothetical protein|nr:hypothetical protein [Pseudobdellovibrionaceae bacterium]
MRLFITVILLIAWTSCVNATTKNLEYIPGEGASATQIMQQVYYVNQFYSFSHVPFVNQPKGLFTLIKKGVKQTYGLQFERYMNFDYSGHIKAKDLVIMKTGKFNGISMLITDYNDLKRSSMVQAWFKCGCHN